MACVVVRSEMAEWKGGGSERTKTHLRRFLEPPPLGHHFLEGSVRTSSQADEGEHKWCGQTQKKAESISGEDAGRYFLTSEHEKGEPIFTMWKKRHRLQGGGAQKHSHAVSDGVRCADIPGKKKRREEPPNTQKAFCSGRKGGRTVVGPGVRLPVKGNAGDQKAFEPTGREGRYQRLNQVALLKASFQDRTERHGGREAGGEDSLWFAGRGLAQLENDQGKPEEKRVPLNGGNRRDVRVLKFEVRDNYAWRLVLRKTGENRIIFKRWEREEKTKK